MNEHQSPQHSQPTFSAFWPVFLLALSMAGFLGWQVSVAVRQYMGSLRLADQQAVVASQAANAEAKLQAVVLDLLKLAETDSDAREIADKYNIKFTPPAGINGRDALATSVQAPPAAAKPKATPPLAASSNAPAVDATKPAP